MTAASKLIKHLENLASKTITVVAEGNYPVKANTVVQHVSAYQNNGTDRGVTPAKFVEAAEQAHTSQWSDAIDEGIQDFLDGRSRKMKKAAKLVADDIGRAVNRIDTGRLKGSMKGTFE
jgi:hypothetical protein